MSRTATAYPNVVVTDLSTSSNGMMCALIRPGNRRPHVVSARHDDEMRIVSPILTPPGSWDDPYNGSLSDLRAQFCDRVDAALPGY